MSTAAAIGGAAVLGAVVSDKSSKRAVNAQEKGAAQARQDLSQSTAQARGDLFKLFPAAQQNAQAGFQGALDVFGQSLPAQQQAFQGGNVAAQQQLLAGLPQMQNALLGNQVDYSQFQPYQAPTQDLSFFQQQLPQYVDPYAPQAQTQQQQLPPKNVGQMLGGQYDQIGGYGGSNRLFNQYLK